MNKFQLQGKTKVIKGSILYPETAGLRFILSINNTKGKVEGNPLLSIFDKKWKQVRAETKGWYANKTGAYKLGEINTTAVQSDIWVIHMLCQDDNLSYSTKAVEDCLKKVAKTAKYENASVHVSSILTEQIPELNNLLQSHLLGIGVSVYFYDEV